MAEALDITKIREDFPILSRTVAGRPLIYLDNAATSQVPRCVVEGIEQMYYTTKANVHRGVHTLSQEATDLVEATREKVREYINAESIEEVIFTRGTTEAIIRLVERLGGEVMKISFVMELAGLKGREKLKNYDVASVICYEGK